MSPTDEGERMWWDWVINLVRENERRDAVLVQRDSGMVQVVASANFELEKLLNMDILFLITRQLHRAEVVKLSMTCKAIREALFPSPTSSSDSIKARVPTIHSTAQPTETSTP